MKPVEREGGGNLATQRLATRTPSVGPLGLALFSPMNTVDRSKCISTLTGTGWEKAALMKYR